MRKFIATTAVGLALTTGAVAVASLSPISTAFAQDTTTQTQPAKPDGGQTDRANHPRARRAVRAAIKDAADTIGIPAKDLAAALKDGQSIADVANAHGVNPQTVIDKLVSDADAKVDQAVQAGKLTQEKADALKAKMSDRVTKLVNKHFDGHRRDAAQTNN